MTPPELLACTAPPEPAVAKIESQTLNGEQQALAPIPLVVHFEDTLAAGKRLWVRGHLAFPAELPKEDDAGNRWRLWGKARPEPPSEVRVETSVNGHVHNAQVNLTGDGHFEMLLEGDLPALSRGWQFARHCLTAQGQTVEKSSVVLPSSRKARQAIVVLLPLASCAGPGSVQRFAQSLEARNLAPVLTRLNRGRAGAVPPLWYVAGVRPGQEITQAELALATASVGWPHGHLVLVPTTPLEPRTALHHALDRLRCLSAGSFELIVFNLEPLAASFVAEQQTSVEDRAPISRAIQPGGDPWSVLATPSQDERSSSRLRSRSRRASLVTQYPIVFCHGMLALSTLKMQLPEDLNCFCPLRDQLQARGFEVFFPQVAPTSGVKERAEQLRDQILRWTDEPVNIVAHSMGGLDARCMITQLDMADRVRSLTTISTPHRGTFLAEWFQETFRRRVPLIPAMEVMGVNMDGVRDCQRANCAEFNEQTPNMPGVRYFSFGGAVTPARVTPALRRGLNLLTPIEGPNDGMVSLRSACWGEYLGTVQADHYAQTPDSVFVRPGEDFDSVRFYSRLVEDLARRGF